MIVNLILLAGIIAVAYLFYQTEQKRQSAERELQEKASQLEELRNTSESSGRQVAAEVLQKVRNHMEVPSDPEPTVATITNIEALRETNEFYSKAKNGDHLIITENRAILFDADKNIIIDVVPVNINQNTQTQQEDGTSPSGSPSPSTSPTPAGNAAQTQATPTPAN